MTKTILTIDDHGDIRRLIRMTLEFFNHTVIEASSGEEGMQLMRTRKPDLVLLDVMMPVMNGLQTAELIRNDPSINQIPIIMLTAVDRSADIAAGLAAGAKFYLSKPFSPADLLDKIDAVFESA
jgi:CheY-like chemotaxis protein